VKIFCRTWVELIGCYYRRWKIEQIFKEEKQLFVLEDVKVRSLKALHRYIYMIMVAHTILVSSKNSNVNPKNPISSSSVYAVSRISCEGVTLKFWEDTYSVYQTSPD